MMEIINIFQLLQRLPLFYLGFGLLFLFLLITKNNFTQPPNIPHKSHTSFFAVFSFLFAIIPAVYFGWGFYQAYFPDYQYEKTSLKVDFHIYEPTYLPNKVKQGTIFRISEKPLFSESPTVSVAYGTSMKDALTEQNNQMIVMMQSKVPASFVLLPYIDQRDETSVPLTKPPTAISITSFPGTSAYLVQQELINQVWLLTKDNVLIVLTSPIRSTPAEELIKIAESLH